jgi:hypothetical protein
MGGGDNVLTLVEQLDVATFILHEESQEVDWLRLSIATANQKTVTAKLATAEAQACFAGKAFSTI